MLVVVTGGVPAVVVLVLTDEVQLLVKQEFAAGFVGVGLVASDEYAATISGLALMMSAMAVSCCAAMVRYCELEVILSPLVSRPSMPSRPNERTTMAISTSSMVTPRCRWRRAGGGMFVLSINNCLFARPWRGR